MRKFVVHTRALPGCCKTGDAPTILEVEGEVLTPMDDSSILWLPDGEFKFRILKPESLYEPVELVKADKSKEKVMRPPVYHSHAVYYTIAGAQAAAERIIRAELDFEIRKGQRTEYSEEELKAKFAEIQTMMLP